MTHVHTPLPSEKKLMFCLAAVSRYSLTNRQQMDQSKNQKLSTEEQVVKVVQGEPEPPSPKVEKPLEEVLSRYEQPTSIQKL